MERKNLYLDIKPEDVSPAKAGYKITEDIQRAILVCQEKYSFGLVFKADEERAVFGSRPTGNPQIDQIAMTFPTAPVIVIRRINNEVYCYPYKESLIKDGYYVPTETRSQPVKISPVGEIAS